MPKRRVKWQAGDTFLIPLKDGSFGQGQVLSYEAKAMNSVLCALSSTRSIEAPEKVDGIFGVNLISIQFVTRDLLDKGYWPLVNNAQSMEWEAVVDIEVRRRKGFIGTTIIGSGNAVDLLNAYHRLLPWDVHHDPEYLDKLLISPDRKPANVLLKSNQA